MDPRDHRADLRGIEAVEIAIEQLGGRLKCRQRSAQLMRDSRKPAWLVIFDRGHVGHDRAICRRQRPIPSIALLPTHAKEVLEPPSTSRLVPG